MNSFWDNPYDHFKDRRYAGLFWSSLMALFGGLVLSAFIAALLFGLGMQEYFLEALPGIGILFVAWVVLKFRQARARSREKLQHGPLSRDELRIARSKLRNGMRRINRPASRVPDTNLRY